MQNGISETFWMVNLALGIILFANVLILLGVKRLQDERYVEILSSASRNAFIFLMVALPFLSALQFVNLPWVEPGLSVFVVWTASLVIQYASSYHYYRR
ncbi:MAG: hypothetical protein ACXADO_05985 [Candidatus Thorarchaeota archaeon]